MAETERLRFDLPSMLARVGARRESLRLAPRESFFSQGDDPDFLVYLQAGRARLTVASSAGKEATLALIAEGDFIGEDAMAESRGPRNATATAVTHCAAIKIARDEMVRAMQRDTAVADLFLNFLLTRSMRVQADLVDQLFNSCEKRLARMLLIMAGFDTRPAEEVPIPKITQEMLAEMIGSTRSRVSFFMNRFRRKGFIRYDCGIHVRKSLSSVVLSD